MTTKYYHWKDKNLYLNLFVQPRASKNTIVGIYGDKLKVQITAPPVDAAANKALIKFLAKHFDIPQAKVQILKGENSRSKLVCIIDASSKKQIELMLPSD
jgi:uncharacterized protein